jgi:1,4-dihydroxy-2-naphthoate polyprenyltransferase
MTAHQEPLPSTLGGTSPGRTLKRYWLATRPPFLSASAAPVVVGSAFGFADAGRIDWPSALLALIATMLVHAAANVLNDVGDETSGTDRANVDRIFPYTGGSRFIQNQVLSLEQMRRFGLGLLGVGSLIGLVLAILVGPTVVLLGVVGAALATAYSLPPLQLAARGVGEIAIAVAFGVLPFCGAAWLQSGHFSGAAVLVSIPIAMWVAAILLINEVPDMAADTTANKRTWPVRVGTNGTRLIYIGLHLTAAFATTAAAALGLIHPLALLGLGAVLLMGLIAARGIVAETDRRARLTASIEATLRIHMMGSLTVLLGILLTVHWA